MKEIYLQLQHVRHSFPFSRDGEYDQREIEVLREMNETWPCPVNQKFNISLYLDDNHNFNNLLLSFLLCRVQTFCQQIISIVVSKPGSGHQMMDFSVEFRQNSIFAENWNELEDEVIP